MVSLFDNELNRDVLRNAEIAAAEERGGNYIGVEPVTGRSIPAVADGFQVEENNAVRIAGPIVQRLTLYAGAKRFDVENTVEWRLGRLFRIEQLFPIAQQKPVSS